MGLTINYRFAFRGTKTDLRRRLDSLRQSYQSLPLANVGQVVEIARARLDTGYGAAPPEQVLQNKLGYNMLRDGYFTPSKSEQAFIALLAKNRDVAPESWSTRDRNRYATLEAHVKSEVVNHAQIVQTSGNGLSLKVDVGEGSEPFSIILGRLGRGKVWHGRGFTKTQYAVHFVDCHLAVIEMLDQCKKSGILESVQDEGQYWETRNLEVLAKNINASTDAIRAIATGLRAGAESAGLEHIAGTDTCANYLRVEQSEEQQGATPPPESDQ